VKTQVIAATELAHPEWATVRAIEFDGWVGITTQMSALEEISGGIDRHAVARLCKSGHPRLTALGCSLGDPRDPVFTEVELLAGCQTLPRLRRLRLASWHRGDGDRVHQRRRGDRATRHALPWLFRAPFGPALELLSATSTIDDDEVMEAWLAEMADWPQSLRTLELSESTSGRFEPPGIAVRFERDARGEPTLVTIRHRFEARAPSLYRFLHELPQILEALPTARVARLVIDSPAPGAVPPERAADLRRIVDRRFKDLKEIRWPAGFG
jgi:hypothetical protein